MFISSFLVKVNATILLVDEAYRAYMNSKDKTVPEKENCQSENLLCTSQEYLSGILHLDVPGVFKLESSKRSHLYKLRRNCPENTIDFV